MTLGEFLSKGDGTIDPKYYARLARVESSGNPAAQSKTSSAAGLYQFTKGTWQGLVKDLGLNYTLEDRFDPDKSQVVIEEFTRRNNNYLSRTLGRSPNEAELYLAHFAGRGGANKILTTLQTNPNATVDTVASNRQIQANRSVFLNKDGSMKKVKDVYNWAANKFGVEQYVEPSEDSGINLFPGTARTFMDDLPTVAVDNTTTRNPRRVDDRVTRESLLQFDKILAIDEARKIREKEIIQEFDNRNPGSEKVEEKQELLYGIEDDGFDPYNYIRLEEL